MGMARANLQRIEKVEGDPQIPFLAFGGFVSRLPRSFSFSIKEYISSNLVMAQAALP